MTDESSRIHIGDFIPVRDDEATCIKIMYGAALMVDNDVVGVSLNSLSFTYGKIIVTQLLAGERVHTNDGETLQYLGFFQDTGCGEDDADEHRSPLS